MRGHRRCERPEHPHHGRWRRERARARARWHGGRKLQRLIFLWLGATILFTGLVVGALFSALSPTEQLQRDREGFTRFVSSRVEEVWDEPAARDAFVRDLQNDLHLDATLYDAAGRLVSRRGAECSEPWGVELTRRSGAPLGRLEVCGQPYQWGGWRFLLLMLVAMAILWGASGILARRLFRPLRRLEHMAAQIAAGDLSVRSQLDPRRHGELGVLGMTMDEMVERIEKQLADQRELLAAVSHELRTPLGHLRLLLEMVRDKPSEERIDEIEAEVMEVDALVAQLLASSRVDFGTLQTKAVDLVELSGRALERADVPVDKLEVEGAATLVEADPTLLARGLANLLRNAEQHGRGVERLLVRFEPSEVVFAVEDGGPGFGAAEREKVFEAFYRGENRAGASLGLGLSLVRRIAEGHGGRAWIEDAEGGGARVLFSISAVEDPSAADEHAALPAQG